jgi:large subunit ribosomal protein L24
MKLKKGDTVVVTAGKDKGKEGKITKVIPKENKVIVEGINVAKKSVKPNGQFEGGIIDIEKPIDASNVMIKDPKTGKPTRIGHTVDKDGKKVRITKKSNEILK